MAIGRSARAVALASPPARWLVPALLLSACAGAAPPSGVSVVLTGATSGDADVERALATPIDPAVELRVAPIPVGTPPPPLALEASVAAARVAYVETADFDACVETLAPFPPVAAALAGGARALAGRALSFLAACHLAVGDDEAAQRVAALLGALDLPIPDETVAVLSPSAERLLADARAAAQAAPRVRLPVRSDPPGARIDVDGRAGACTAPCALELAPGRHVIGAVLDGRDDVSRVIEVPGEADLELALAPARPEAAAAQWRARHTGAVETWPSLQLLQIAAGDRRLVLLAGESTEGSGLRLRATLAVDDLPPRRIERLAAPGASAEVTRGALRDLLREAGVIPPRPLVEEPWLWIATVGGAAVAALITGLALYEPEVRVPVVVLGRAP